MIEVRGIGLLRLPYEPAAVVGLVIDLAADDATRMPDGDLRWTEIIGISLPRLAVAAGAMALPSILAFINSPKAGWI